MTDNTIPLSMEGAMLANLFVIKNVVEALVAKNLLTQPEMQLCFESAKKDLHRSTLAISANEADQLMRLIWGGYTPTGGAQPH